MGRFPVEEDGPADGCEYMVVSPSGAEAPGEDARCYKGGPSMSSVARSRHAWGVKPVPTLFATILHFSFSYSANADRSFWSVSSVHCVVFAFSLVQYRTCKVPLDLPGKKSAICFHVKLLFSFRSTRSVSSSCVNFNFGPRGCSAGAGIPGCPTTLGAPPPAAVPSSRLIILEGGPVSGSL